MKNSSFFPIGHPGSERLGDQAKLVWGTLALALVYILSGKLSLLLAVPPGYASAIFPPAGIAVAAVLISGKRAFPGIFIGALLMNLLIPAQSSSPGTAAALLIALASLLQAGLGGWALRKVFGYPIPFDQARDTLLFLLLPPVICLVSATLSVAGLWALGLLTAKDLVSSWAVWWVGDTLGVLVMVPLTLVLLGDPRALWRSRTWAVALPMLLAFGLFVAIFVRVNEWERSDTLLEFRIQSQQVADNLQTRLEEQASLLEQAEGWFALGEQVSPMQFKRFAQRSLRRFPIIQKLEWAPLVGAKERTAFEATQAALNPGYQIREAGPTGSLKRAADRSYFYPIAYLEPSHAHANELGFDLAATPARRMTLNKAMQKETVMSASLHGPQLNDLQLLLGVNRSGGQSGFLLVSLNVQDLMQSLAPPNSAALWERLVDLDTQQTLYSNFTEPKSLALSQRNFKFGERHYRLETAPAPSYFEVHRGWQSWGVLAAGTLGTGLLGALLMLASGHAARVGSLVEQRSAELRESETRLHEIASALGEGVYVVDQDGRITFSNPEAQRLLGWSEQELLGADAHALFHYMKADCTPLTPEECTVHSVAQASQSYRGEESFWRKDGSRLPVELCSSPIIRAGQVVGVVVAFSDITARKQLEDKLLHEATYDALTDLPNRRFFMERLQEAIYRAQRNGKGGAVLFMDLDEFKQINDSYGHEVGDKTLCLFAQRLHASVRKTDTVARLGGDEFTILLEGLTNPLAEAEAVANKVITHLATPATVGSYRVQMSTSIGITVFNAEQEGTTPDSVLSRADAAMYQAKQAGKNTVASKK